MPPVSPLAPDRTPARASGTGAAAACRGLVLAAVASGMFMAMLDTTIVNVALPTLQHAFGASTAQLAWIVDAYALSFAALLMMGGAASDRIGAKRAYLAGLGLFLAASAACGMAPSLTTLVLARLVQGLGASLFLPASLALVRQAFEDERQRARAIVLWAAIASAAGALGPVIGGVLLDGFGWRSAFLVNVPIGLAGLALTATLVARSQPAARAFDLPGQLTSTLALGAACFAAIELPERGPAAVHVWLPALASVAAAAAFLRVERRAPAPMVPLAWFGDRVFASMAALGALVCLGYYGVLFVLSLDLQGGHGLSAHQAGLALLPMAASLAAGNLLSQPLMRRFGRARLIAASLAVAAPAVVLGTWALAKHGPMAAAQAALVVFGMGTALSVAPMIATVLDRVDPAQSGLASGLLNAVRQVGSLAGVAAGSACMALAQRPHAALWGMAAIASAAYGLAAWLAHRCGLDRQGAITLLAERAPADPSRDPGRKR